MQALPRLGCFEGFKKAFCNYINFSGRARRSEYWWFSFTRIIIISIGMIPYYCINNESTAKLVSLIINIIISLIFFLPNLSVTVRRLHDTGRSGCYFFLLLIPIIGTIIIFYFTICDSQESTNEYGPSPKYIQLKSSFLENSKYYQMNDYN